MRETEHIGFEEVLDPQLYGGGGVENRLTRWSQ